MPLSAHARDGRAALTTLDRNGPGYRAAQMGRVTGALVVLAVVLLLAAGAALVVQGPGADAVVSHRAAAG